MNQKDKEVENSPPNLNLLVALEVHSNLMKRFGEYKTSDWEPNDNNIIVMEDDEFDKFMVSQMEESEASDEEKSEHSKNIIGYANFKDKKLYMRTSLELSQ